MPILAVKALQFLLSPLGRALGIALAVILVIAGVHRAGTLSERHKWEAAELALKLEASAIKAKADAAARSAEGRAFALGIQISKERNDHAQQLAAVQGNNDRLAGDFARLLVDARRRNGGADLVPDSAAAAAGAAARTASGEFLDAVGALVAASPGFAREADDTALDGIAWHDYAVGLPAAMKVAP